MEIENDGTKLGMNESFQAPMERRHPESSYMSKMNNTLRVPTCSHPCPNSCPAWEVHSGANRAHSFMTNASPSLNSSMEDPRYGPISVSSYQQFTPQQAGSSSSTQFPPGFDQWRLFYSNSSIASGSRNAANTPIAGHRTGVKRRAHFPITRDKDYHSGYDNGASSSNLLSPSHQHRRRDYSSMSEGSHITHHALASDGFSRNVRSRYSQNQHLQPNPNGQYLSIGLPRTMYPRPVNLPPLPMSSNQNPAQFFSSSGLSPIGYPGSSMTVHSNRLPVCMSSHGTQTDAFVGAGIRNNGIVGANRPYYRNIPPPMQALVAYHMDRLQMGPSYGTSSGAEPAEYVRNQCPPFRVPRSLEWSGRSINLDNAWRRDGFQVGSSSEGGAAEPVFYEDPWSLLDQHRGMRMDIDTISLRGIACSWRDDRECQHGFI